MVVTGFSLTRITSIDSMKYDIIAADKSNNQKFYGEETRYTDEESIHDVKELSVYLHYSSWKKEFVNEVW